jgi:hypothetical protein
LAYEAVGALMAALSHPLAQRRIPRNGLYGFKVPATLSDDAVWYEVNARTGRETRALGLCLMPTMLLIQGAPMEAYVIMINLLVIVPLVVILLRGYKLANRLRAESASRSPSALAR